MGEDREGDLNFLQMQCVKNIDLQFEKWCAIRASVGGVGGVLAWVT